MNTDKYYDKYLKYKNKYLKLKNQVSNKIKKGGMIMIEATEPISEHVNIKTIIFGNDTGEEITMSPLYSKQLINYGNDPSSGECDFWTDFEENDPITLEKDEYYILIVGNNNLLGYMTFKFNINIMENHYKLDNYYMSLNIITRCSFTKNPLNDQMFKYIKSIKKDFSFGKYVWIKFKEFLLLLKGRINQQYRPQFDWKYFIYNHPIASAIPYHTENGMMPITDETRFAIFNTPMVDPNDKNKLILGPDGKPTYLIDINNSEGTYYCIFPE